MVISTNGIPVPSFFQANNNVANQHVAERHFLNPCLCRVIIANSGFVVCHVILLIVIISIAVMSILGHPSTLYWKDLQ